MHTKLHPHPDTHIERRDVLDTAHQAEPLIHVNERNVVGLTLLRRHHGSRVYGAYPLAGPPFQVVTASDRADDPWVKYCDVCLGAELIGQFTLGQIVEVDAKRRGCSVCHQTGLSPATVTRWPDRVFGQ